jgi:hypothetical protein
MLPSVSDTREPFEAARRHPFCSTPESNPFATRFTQPGALPYRFCHDPSREKAAAYESAAGTAEPFRSPTGPKSNGDPSNSGPSNSNPSTTGHDRAMDQLVRGLVRDRIGVIVGPHGTGKSTLLHTLMPSLHREFAHVDLIRLHGGSGTGALRRWRHARRVGRQVFSTSSCAGEGALLVVDGIEQVSGWHRRRLLWCCRRRGQAVLATSHRPLPGMSVLHRTWIHAELIEELVERLLGPASAEVSDLVRAELERRDLDRVGNLRDLWFELYDVVQPMLITSPVSDTSKMLHGRTLVRPHDPIASADRQCGADR